MKMISNSCPKVSVIIPTYNRMKIISRAINSVVNQTFEDWELIIVDDGSTDNTFQVLKMNYLNKERIYYHQRPLNRPKGANACRNIGAEKSKGIYLAFLDSDDEWLPMHLENKVELLENSSAKFIFGSFYLKNNEVTKKIICNYEGNNHERIDKFIASDGDLRTSTFVVNKDTFLNYKFDENLKKHQDWDFALRFGKDLKFDVEKTPTVIMHMGQRRMSHTMDHDATALFLAKHDEYLSKMAYEKILTLVGYQTFRQEGRSEVFLRYVKDLRRNKSISNIKSLLVGYVLPVPLFGYVINWLSEFYFLVTKKY